MLTYLLEVTMCWALFYLIFVAILRKVTFFRVNRWYLLSGLTLGILIPLLRFLEIDFYQEDIAQMAPIVYVIKDAPAQIATSVVEQTMDWGAIIYKVLLSLYLLGVGVFSFRFLKGLLAIYRLYSFGSKEHHSYYTLVHTNKEHLPFSFFDKVFLSTKTPMKEGIDDILQHELAHVESKHSIDVLFLEVVNIVFWFHPLIYLYKTAIRQTHEYIADQVVLKNTHRQTYGTLLLKQSMSGLQIALAHQFFHSHIKKRINMMYQKKSGQSAWLKYTLALPVLLLLFIVFSSHRDQPYTTLQFGEDIQYFQNTLKGSIGPISFYNVDDASFETTEGFPISHGFKNLLTNYNIDKHLLLVIDGEEILLQSDIYLVPHKPFHVENMTWFSPEAAIKKYGQNGQYGALEFEGIVQGQYVSLETPVRKTFEQSYGGKDKNLVEKIIMARINKAMNDPNPTTRYVLPEDVVPGKDGIPSYYNKNIELKGPVPFFDGAKSRRESDEKLRFLIDKYIRISKVETSNEQSNKVYLTYIIETDGTVSNIRESNNLFFSSRKNLIPHAIRVAKKVFYNRRFTPAMFEGKPIKVEQRLMVDFSVPSDKNYSKGSLIGIFNHKENNNVVLNKDNNPNSFKDRKNNKSSRDKLSIEDWIDQPNLEVGYLLPKDDVKSKDGTHEYQNSHTILYGPPPLFDGSSKLSDCSKKIESLLVAYYKNHNIELTPHKKMSCRFNI